MKPQRLAAIDIGTNSIRSIIVEATGKKNFRVLDDEKEITRIGEGMGTRAHLSRAAMQRTLRALQRMTDIARGFGAETVQAVATSAVREAKNRDTFLRRVEDEIGLKVRVITAEEEAWLAFLSMLHHFDVGKERFCGLDIGGGSAALIFGLGAHIENIHCLPLGAVRLTEKFLHRDPVSPGEFKKLRRHIKQHLLPIKNSGEVGAQMLIGSGGTLTTIAELHKAMQHEKYTGVHGYDMNRGQVKRVLDLLRRKSLKERRSMTGLNPDRADIIIAGVTVVNEAMKVFNINALKVSDFGIREGLILQMIAGLSGQGDGAFDQTNTLTKFSKADWRESVKEFAESCRYEAPHSQHVTRLALSLFDQLFPASDEKTANERELLEAASLLHDIGYFINYTRHHKHSYHLIVHSHLVGFSPREIAIIANVARYHRRAEPRRKHENFAALSRPDQKLVLKLSAILRLADGLDRSHSQRIQEIRCERRKKRLTLYLISDKDIDIEIWGAKQKAGLFEEVFKLKIEYQHVTPKS
ncbi:MAG: Ppx/GppA family phosphatase [candidate division KSB1 bacterium]|nr:Ppx/GppA family phosphatase [candidate division KSB1 bacterium]MDZ7367787.1 Ppx/GppA family phosphatase [candidate division KSB1 bacterium]MDZ7406622.1 Ppx/GppA family phosphatase [candidate division KSB1 bacterium]